MTSYEKDKAKRDFQFKEERTDLQRVLGDLSEQARIIVTLLLVIAMILGGIFLRLVFGA